MNHIEGLKEHPAKSSTGVSYLTYRGYDLVPHIGNLSIVMVNDRNGFICALHTDVAIATIDSWLHAP